MTDEADRIRDAYARRAQRGADDRYELDDPANRYLFGRREGYVVVSQKVGGRVRVPVDW